MATHEILKVADFQRTGLDLRDQFKPKDRREKMRLQQIVYVFACGILLGCTNVQPILAPTAAADPSAGYVAGYFSRWKIRGFAFVIRSVDRGAEYNMPLGEESNWSRSMDDQSVAIRLPPGNYVVSHWITYSNLTKEITSRKEISNSMLSQPFIVKSGEVTHLGSYDVSEYTHRSYPTITTYFRIQPRQATQAETHATFAAAYPNLATQPFHCVLCVDTIGPSPSPG